MLGCLGLDFQSIPCTSLPSSSFLILFTSFGISFLLLLFWFSTFIPLSLVFLLPLSSSLFLSFFFCSLQIYVFLSLPVSSSVSLLSFFFFSLCSLSLLTLFSFYTALYFHFLSPLPLPSFHTPLSSFPYFRNLNFSPLFLLPSPSYSPLSLFLFLPPYLHLNIPSTS